MNAHDAWSMASSEQISDDLVHPVWHRSLCLLAAETVGDLLLSSIWLDAETVIKVPGISDIHHQHVEIGLAECCTTISEKMKLLTFKKDIFNERTQGFGRDGEMKSSASSREASAKTTMRLFSELLQTVTALLMRTKRVRSCNKCLVHNLEDHNLNKNNISL